MRVRTAISAGPVFHLLVQIVALNSQEREEEEEEGAGGWREKRDWEGWGLNKFF